MGPCLASLRHRDLRLEDAANGYKMFKGQQNKRALASSGGAARRCRRKFLSFFPGGFSDVEYRETERDYKWESHLRWRESLHESAFKALLEERRFSEIAARAIRVEQRSRYSMIFSFEKMALRDAVRSPAGARAFAGGLFALLHGKGSPQTRFEQWVETVAGLPRKGTRVLTWPLVTVFGFLAQPTRHMFMKPKTMRAAASAYGFELQYHSKPNWTTYESLLSLAAQVRHDLADLAPQDMIDVQSFLWVQGSVEYD